MSTSRHRSANSLVKLKWTRSDVDSLFFAQTHLHYASFPAEAETF